MTLVEGLFWVPILFSFFALVYRRLASKKLCFASVSLFAADIVNHGSHLGNTAQALAQWQHPVASRKALDVLHWAMHPALYRPLRMAIEISSSLPAFFLSLISLLATTVANNYVMVIII
jgi:hypothetical protein